MSRLHGAKFRGFNPPVPGTLSHRFAGGRLRAWRVIFRSQMAMGPISIAMTARSQSPLAVFVGAMAGFGLLTLIGVAFGGLIARFVPEAYVRFAAGGLFILFGILILLGKGWK